ncbi:hypothetical protein CAEBREN_09482 [Caenorhabditis brenneri]|uniref:RRM domain-containing protein n=1 Tax=Caenorhabditis brenneri TaxID=135651 RepID=G0ME06_CAEBE|nr:hypothetical protein CAEBREN_09482 [Caenorhabditis brenneri]
MVKRIFVQGLSSNTNKSIVRKYFEQFGALYECVVPIPPRYTVEDLGPNDEDIEARSSIHYKPAGSEEVLDDEQDVEPYDSEKHGSFESYMKKVGDGELFINTSRRLNAGYAYITFVDMDGYSRCMQSDVHEINGAQCTVELAKDEEQMKAKVDSKRLFVSYFPLDRLTAKELKSTFGAYGKITDVEVLSDVLVFTRRAVTKEAIKMAEQKQKEQNRRQRNQQRMQRTQLLPNHTAYPMPSQPVTSIPSTSSAHRVYDPSAAAGYAPLYSQPPPPIPENNAYSSYGYGPRKW